MFGIPSQIEYPSEMQTEVFFEQRTECLYINMLSIGIGLQPYRVIPTLLGSDLGVLGHMRIQNVIITSWLRLTATSTCFPYPY